MVEEVRLQKITKKYGDSVAVSEVDLSVGKGEYHFILGLSGCGKTVLLRLISGLEMPSSGDIYIGNERVNEIPAHERRIPVVFQNFALFPHLNVRENIEYGLRIRGASKRKKNAQFDARGIISRINALQSQSHFRNLFPTSRAATLLACLTCFSARG